MVGMSLVQMLSLTDTETPARGSEVSCGPRWSVSGATETSAFTLLFLARTSSRVREEIGLVRQRNLRLECLHDEATSMAEDMTRNQAGRAASAGCWPKVFAHVCQGPPNLT